MYRNNNIPIDVANMLCYDLMINPISIQCAIRAIISRIFNDYVVYSRIEIAIIDLKFEVIIIINI
jgi:hypothetical protein